MLLLLHPSVIIFFLFSRISKIMLTLAGKLSQKEAFILSESTFTDPIHARAIWEYIRGRN